MRRYSRGGVVFAPDVLVAALAVRGGICSKALERAVDEGMGIVTSRLLLRCTLVTLVELFECDADAIARAAVLLDRISTGIDSMDEPGVPRGIDVTRHLAYALSVGGADRIVVSPSTPGFGNRWHTGETFRYAATGAPWHAYSVHVRDFVREGALHRLPPDLTRAERQRLDAIAGTVAERAAAVRGTG